MKKYLLLSGIFILIQVHAQEPAQKSAAHAKDADYYMMKNNNLIHFLATGEVETVMNTATLSNGTVISSKGEIVSKQGEKIKLANGECINADGKREGCAMLDSMLTKQVKPKQ